MTPQSHRDTERNEKKAVPDNFFSLCLCVSVAISSVLKFVDPV
jgi:hypothetical protein